MFSKTEGKARTLWFAAAVLVVLATLALRGVAETGEPAPPVAGDPVDAEIDRLILHEDFVTAFELAVGELRARSERSGRKHRETLISLQRIAMVAHLGGDQTLAEESVDLALRLRRELLGAGHPDVAESLYLRGVVARYNHDRDLSRRCLEEAKTILEQAGQARSSLMADIVQAQASWLRAVGYEVATERYEEALALRRQLGESTSFEIADTLTWLGWTLSRDGNDDEAEPYLDEAERRLQALGLDDHSRMGTVLHLRADSLAIAGNWESAEPLYRRVAAIYESARAKHLPVFGRRKIPLDGYRDLALTQLKLGRPEEAWYALQRGTAALTAEFLALGRWRETAREDFARSEPVRLQYLDVKDELNQVRSEAITRDVDREWELLLSKLSLRSELQRQEQRALSEYRLDVPSLEAMQAALPPHTAYVGRLRTMQGAVFSDSGGPVLDSEWLYVLQRSGPIVWIPIRELRDVRDVRAARDKGALISRTLERATRWKLRVEPDPELERLTDEYCAVSIGPVLPHLESVDTVVFEAAPVQHVDCEGLLTADGRTFGDRFITSETPSAVAFLSLATRERESGRAFLASVLSVGDPSFTGHQAETDDSKGWANGRLASRMRRELESTNAPVLARLRYSGIEARSVSSMFSNSTLLVEADATEKRIRELVTAQRLAEFDVVHLATHSLMDPRPERCALAFSPSDDDDGLVDVEDILYRWHLGGGMVALSGCRTGRGAGQTRYEFFGVLQALMSSGATSIVSTRRNADDWATSELMRRFYENLTGHYDEPRDGLIGVAMGRARALREAKIWLRDYTLDDGSRPFAHPVYWAQFTILGPPG